MSFPVLAIAVAAATEARAQTLWELDRGGLSIYAEQTDSFLPLRADPTRALCGDRLVAYGYVSASALRSAIA